MGLVFNRKHQKGTRQRLRTQGTRAEILLWRALKHRQFEGLKFRRQQGILEYIVDFYCPELRLAIEIDGVSHDSDEARERDARRQRAISSFDIVFFRVRDEAVKENVDSVVEELRDVVRRVRSGKAT
jgi:very-short-patch-repair endonuclease